MTLEQKMKNMPSLRDMSPLAFAKTLEMYQLALGSFPQKFSTLGELKALGITGIMVRTLFNLGYLHEYTKTYLHSGVNRQKVLYRRAV